MTFKYLFLILASITSFSALNAQSPSLRKFIIGVEAGPNLTETYGKSDRPLHSVPALGFSCGINFQATIVKHFSFKSSLSYERKVEKIKEDVFHSDETSQTFIVGRGHSNFDYLTLPLLIQFDFGNKVNFFTNAGPYLGILLKGSGFVETPDNSIYKFTPDSNAFDFGITCGLGIAFSIKENYRLTFEARNNLGLLPLYSKYKEIKINSTALLFGFSYGFR